MKRIFLPALIFSAGSHLFSQGFPSTSINWGAPNGGKLSGGITYGYNSIGGLAVSSDNSGSQSWSLMDMNGDGKADLVIPSQLQNNDVTCFSPGSGPYWKVYLNTGTGFSSTAMNWNLPNGGKLSGGVTFGFDNLSGVAVPNDNGGSQSWATLDIDGDHKPDLVVTAQLQGIDVTCFSPGSSPFWKVYLNNGTGFSSSAINWPLPNGGKLTGGVTKGYDHTGGTALPGDNAGSQSWSIMDIDGDSKPELVVTAQLQGTDVTCFSPGSGPFWKVYDNNGTGFSTSAANWNLPNGGKLTGGITYGFDAFAGMASTTDNSGAQNWTLLDVTGDKKPDLIITAQLQGNDITCFSPGANPYWKVYANMGNSFSTTPTNWTLPNGGKLSGGITYGYDLTIGFASPAHNTGSQSWDLADLDGNGTPDLVVTAQLQGIDVTCFSPGNSPYWKVYGNNGTGFNSTSKNWSLPQGGKLSGGVTSGFDALSGYASSTHNSGSQSWAMIDMNNNKQPDLIVVAQLQGGDVTSFSPSSSQYWKVFENTGELAVSENSKAVWEFIAYPNPVRGSFYIKAQKDDNIILLNELGCMIDAYELSALNDHKYEIKGLAPGIYVLKSNIQTIKMVVLE